MTLSTAQLQSYATTFAQQENVPPELFLAQIGQESNWNVYAQNGNAAGIAQFMPDTAASLGVDLGTSDQQVLSQLQGAAIYDAQLYAKTGSWSQTMQSYGTTANGNGASVAQLAGQLDSQDTSTMVSNAVSTGLGLVNPVLGAGYSAASSIEQSGGIGSWIESHAGNYSLIIFGAVLAVGALLFSQRENVTKVVKVAGKVAAVAT